MKLYEINSQLERLLMLDTERAVDTETGEILTAEEVDQLQMDRNEKIENCLLFSKNMNAEADAIKVEIDKLTARMKACKNKADWAREYVQNTLHGEKFKTARVAVSYGKTKSVHISFEDMALLPETYRKVKYEADKTALKKAIEGGAVIDGVEIVEKQTMRIR